MLARMSYGQHGSALSGTIAATTSGTLWSYTYRPAAGSTKRLKVKRMHVQVTTLTAFTTPVTVGRALRLCLAAPEGASKGEPTGGVEWNLRQKHPDGEETLGKGHVATTSALTTTGMIVGDPRRRLSLVHAGFSGAMVDEEWRYDDADGPVYLAPGRSLLIQTDAALDAAGTIQLKVDFDGEEVGA